MLLRQFRRLLEIKKIIANGRVFLLDSLLNNQNTLTNNSEKKLVTRIPPAQLKKLQKLHIKRSNNLPMVSFVHNGSGITTWMGYSFKQNQKHKIQSNIFKPQGADN